MGVGRRMKKQAPPVALTDSQFEALKQRKLGNAPSAADPRGTKRKASGEIIAPPPIPNKKFTNGAKNSGLKKSSKGTFAPPQSVARSTKSRPTSAPKSRGQPVEEEVDSSDNDAADLLGGDSGDEGEPFGDVDEEVSVLKQQKPGKGRISTGSIKRNEKLNGTLPGRKRNGDKRTFNGALIVDEDMDASELDDEDDEPLPDDFLDSGSSVYDSDEHAKAIFSEDEDESDAEEKLTAANIAGLSRTLDAKKKQEADEAQLELEEAALQTNIDGDRPDILEDVSDSDDPRKPRALLAPDLQLLRSRITETIRVLSDFSKLATPGTSRSTYTSQLLKDICAYYGYSPYLAEKLFNLFTPAEAFAFFEANETARPLVIRTNTLKTSRRELAQTLINRGVTLEPVGKWSKVGLQVFESQVPLGATPEYLAGHYILQAASSFLPVMALAPQEHERILDMAAAPGGKTTHMAALMKNTGCIFANDSNKQRAKGLIGNIHRLGAKNTIVCNHDAREFPKIIGGFDRVLLDAPCSGTGVIAKDPSVKTNKDEKDFMQLPHLQKQLLLAAIDSTDHSSKTGGYIVYSTCSVSVEENEMVVAYALRKRPNIKLVETGLVFGVEGFAKYRGKDFGSEMSMTRRYYPHKYNVDGFFVAKFKKTGPSTGEKVKGVAQSGDTTDRMDVDGGAHVKGNDTTALVEDGDENGEDGFGGWEDEEADQAIIERAQRRLAKKKGQDPKADRRKARPKSGS
ncbi:rRNA (cytosine-C5-)-methyltransferase nop2 [Agyrium rufum]|nr:rRNA (cytosine-C5-)-methyltransferase nop2 [Agyrium rufum]